jgi:addiction module HigA family antidote
MKTKHINIHPGEIIGEDFLSDYGLTKYALAKALGIPQSRLTEIIKGRRSITADTALRLGRYFGNSPEFWLGLQGNYDLREARHARGHEIVSAVHPHGQAA